MYGIPPAAHSVPGQNSAAGAAFPALLQSLVGQNIIDTVVGRQLPRFTGKRGDDRLECGLRHLPDILDSQVGHRVGKDDQGQGRRAQGLSFEPGGVMEAGGDDGGGGDAAFFEVYRIMDTP